MSIMIPLLILLGLIILMVVLWFVWKLIKCVIVLILIAVIVVALWYLGDLEQFIPFSMQIKDPLLTLTNLKYW